MLSVERSDASPSLSSSPASFTLNLLRLVMDAHASSDKSTVSVNRIILAQRMAFPIGGHHDPLQVRVISERMPNRSKTSRSYQFAVARLT